MLARIGRLLAATRRLACVFATRSGDALTARSGDHLIGR